MQHLPKISLIATTYNRPDALRLCIESIGRQTLVPFEVIIADDGSTDDTRTLIERMRKDFPCPIVHAWQEYLGSVPPKYATTPYACAKAITWYSSMAT